MLGIEAVPEPFTNGVVLWMRSIVQGIEKFCKAVGPATILGRTIAGSRHAAFGI